MASFLKKLIFGKYADEMVEYEQGKTGTAADQKDLGDHLVWRIEDDVVYISGQGETYNFTWETCPWGARRSRIRRVVIEEGLTAIGDCTFEKCTELVEISLPESLQEIRYSAFLGCEKLEEIHFPPSLHYVARNAFRGTAWVKSQGDFPAINGILHKYMGSSGQVTVPSHIREIGDGAFYAAKGIQSVTLPEGLEIIGPGAFGECSLTEISLPASLKEIRTGAFIRSGLTRVHVPGKETMLSEGVFSNCADLTDVILDNEITKLPARLFSCCRELRYLTLPACIREIDDEVFQNCRRLVDVAYAGTKEEWDKIQVGKDNKLLKKAMIRFEVRPPAEGETRR